MRVHLQAVELPGIRLGPARLPVMPVRHDEHVELVLAVDVSYSMDLDELAGDEIQGQTIITHEHVMANGGRQHAAFDELQREMDDGQGWGLERSGAGANPTGRL